jgi:hypothetical protein
MDKVQKYNSFNTNTPSSESYTFLCFPGERDYSSEEVLSGFQPASVVLLS